MAHPVWTQQDLDQMTSLGISPIVVEQQINLFKNPPVSIHLVRPAILKDGIVKLSDAQIASALRTYEAEKKRFIKFVPASGAATRMFQSLFKFVDTGMGRRTHVEEQAVAGDKEAERLLELMDNLPKVAFYHELEKGLAEKGLILATLLERGDYGPVLSHLLGAEGLDYAQLPKGLVPFHRHLAEIRTPFIEHLIEGEATAEAVHFTVSQEHRSRFENRLAGSAKGKGLAIEFSVQDPATQTIAVTGQNEPFRDEKGKLVFRPAGHGALIKNLDRLQADLVFIKNIDNVAVEPFSTESVFWKKVLGGYLAGLQQRIFGYLEGLESSSGDKTLLEQTAFFCRNELNVDLGKDFLALGDEGQKERLIAVLERPLRVCGVVPNTGEPGGGPFWVRGSDGFESPQIVESAQVNRKDEAQMMVFERSTHFNPVDLVCGLRDRSGKPFGLENYVDRKAVFISEKSINGVKVKALELPGLWNGAMADWITVFVEVPASTFNPVKTVFDLLRPAHQG